MQFYWEYEFTFEVRGENHLDVPTERVRRYGLFPAKLTIDVLP